MHLIQTGGFPEALTSLLKPSKYYIIELPEDWEKDLTEFKLQGVGFLPQTDGDWSPGRLCPDTPFLLKPAAYVIELEPNNSDHVAGLKQEDKGLSTEPSNAPSDEDL